MSLSNNTKQAGNALPYWSLLAGFLLLILAGYGGFRAFAAISDPGALNLYALAIVAGIASFFSPCAFPLLPSYFAFYSKVQGETESTSSNKRALELGMAAVLGVIAFDLLLGGGIAVFGSGLASGLSVSGAEPSQFVQLFRGAVGIVLLILGIGQLSGWNLKPDFVEEFVYRMRPEREGKRSASRNLFFYGLGYTAAGMGCTGPILAGLLVLAVSSGGALSALTAFFVFSLTMGALMLIVSGLVVASQDSLIAQLKSATPKIKTASSIVLILVGSFSLVTALNTEFFLNLLFR